MHSAFTSSSGILKLAVSIVIQSRAAVQRQWAVVRIGHFARLEDSSLIKERGEG